MKPKRDKAQKWKPLLNGPVSTTGEDGQRDVDYCSDSVRKGIGKEKPRGETTVNFYELFKEALEGLRKRFGVSNRKGVYVGWMPPINRQQARSMARDIARKQQKEWSTNASTKA